MVVRLKFGRPGSPREAAAIEPFSSALLGALHEMTRRREIVWRHFERTERRHDANIYLVRELLDIVDERHAINRVIACKAHVTAPLGGSSKAQA